LPILRTYTKLMRIILQCEAYAEWRSSFETVT
jgi:hypothetical protein